MKKKQSINPNTEFAVISLLLSVLVTVLNNEFPNLKPRILDWLYGLQRIPGNADMFATIEEAILRVEGLR